MPKPECKQDSQQCRVSGRPSNLDLSTQVIVKYAGGGAEIDQPVEQLPSAAAEASYPFFCGSDRKRNKHEETDKSRNNERAFQEDVLKHRGEIKVLIQPDVGSQVDEAIEERKKPQHSPEAD